MYSSNNPKISQHTRNQIWLQYQASKSNSKSKFKHPRHTQKSLALQYGVSSATISKIIHRGRKGDFNIHSPINKRYLTQEYIKKREQKEEIEKAKKLERKLKREEIKKNRYEHKQPGELGHMDLKLLPPIQGQKIIKGQKEYLLTLVDDCTRIAYFTIIQGKINIKLHMV